MKAREIMTADPACCTPDTIAAEAARLMEQHDCGCIPVVEGERSHRLIGVLTDRDLALRGLARGGGPGTPVRELMSEDVGWCTPETDVREVERIMAERQVRRVPVIDDLGNCVGMIAQADLARESRQHRLRERELAWVIERVSESGGLQSLSRAAASGSGAEPRASEHPSVPESGDTQRGITDERLDSIRQGIAAPRESPVGRAAEEERRRRAAEGPQIGGGMGGTSDAETPGGEAAMNRALRDAARRGSARGGSA
jgi:CBS domain-containing protein